MTGNRFYYLILIFAALAFLLSTGAVVAKEGGKIIHDAEYYVLEAQNGEKWVADDKKIDKKLAEIREKNGGKPPNIIYILLDDLGFGEIGMPDFAVTRGYKTPNLDALARNPADISKQGWRPNLSKRGAIRSAFDGRYKLNRYFSPLEHHTPRSIEELYANNDVELFDLISDPNEMNT